MEKQHVAGALLSLAAFAAQAQPDAAEGFGAAREVVGATYDQRIDTCQKYAAMLPMVAQAKAQGLGLAQLAGAIPPASPIRDQAAAVYAGEMPPDSAAYRYLDQCLYELREDLARP